MKVLYPPLDEGEGEFEVGPALFGPDLGENEFQVCTTQDTSVYSVCTPQDTSMCNIFVKGGAYIYAA